MKPSGQNEPHRMKLTVERVKDQSKTFKRRGAQQRLIAVFAENHGGRAAVTAIFEIGVTDPAGDDRSIGEREIEFSVGSDSDGFEPFSGRSCRRRRSRSGNRP